MTHQDLKRLMTAAQADSVCMDSMDRKLHHLMRQHEQTVRSPLPHIRPITGFAVVLLMLGGVLGLAHAVREVQYVAAHYQQEQIDMREARRNMLSNTEHIYSVLFQNQQ